MGKKKDTPLERVCAKIDEMRNDLGLDIETPPADISRIRAMLRGYHARLGMTVMVLKDLREAESEVAADLAGHLEGIDHG